jgi:hypothetical protein
VIILFNPRYQASKLPAALSIVALGAVTRKVAEYQIVDGNLGRYPNRDNTGVDR